MRIALVVADSVRADAPGFGGGQARTPFLDKLASEGVVFTHALSCAPWTVPSLSSMVTGVYSHRLGLYLWDQPIPSQYDTIFAIFADHGYQVASFVFDPNHLFSSMPDARVIGSSQVADKVFDWISSCSSPNLFVLVHYWGTHFPYIDKPMTVPAWKSVTEHLLGVWNKNPAAVTPKMKALYARALERFSETFLPRLVEAIGSHASFGAKVVFTADHGESWGEHFPGSGAPRDVFDMHGNHLRNEVLRVPLVLWETEARGRKVPELVRNIDLAPTLVALAGIPSPWPESGPAAIDGTSLVSLLEGKTVRKNSLVACCSRDFIQASLGPSSLRRGEGSALASFHPLHGDQNQAPRPTTPEALWTAISLQRDNWKLLWNLDTGERSVFDLESDPEEKQPLSVGSIEPEDAWKQLEDEWRRATCTRAPDPTDNHLRSLGYLE